MKSLAKLPAHIIRRLQPETLEQIAVMEWLRWTHPDIVDCVMHIPNERKQNKIWGLVLAHMGVLPGASDLFIAVPRKMFHGMFLEMKTKKGRLTENQKTFLQDMKSQGYHASAAYGSDDAIYQINNYLKLPNVA